jgi:hypothetical protein
VRGSCYFAPGILEQHSSLFSSLFATEAKLEKLTCYLAVEVIEQWRAQVLKKLPPVSEALKDWGLGNWDENEILTSLGKIDSKWSLFDELNYRLERERSLSRLPQRQRVIFAAASLQQAVAGLETWLIADVADRSNCGCRARLQLNAQNLRIQTSNRLKQYISEFWSVTGPESLLAWLKDMESQLVAANYYYEEQQQEYRHKSDKARNSYQNLLEKLQQSSVSEKAQEILTYAWTALASVYQFKIQAEINGLASQLVVGLIQQIQSYSNILLQANDFLLNLQKQIVEKDSLREVSGSYLAIALAEKTLPSQLREELSLAMGNSLNQWGNSISITSDRLKKYLLERLRPIALDIYRESCREICQISADEPKKEF